jgi:HEAT repeat protein
MGLFGNGKPNVKTLARRADVAGLVGAATFQDVVSDARGGTVDVGAPLREEAILALGGLGADAGAETVVAALADPADRVRVAAVRVLYARRSSTELAEALAWLPAGRGHSRRLALNALAQLRRPDCADTLAAALTRASGHEPVGDEEVALLMTLLEADDGPAAADAVLETLVSALADVRDTVADRAQDLLMLLAPASTEVVISELETGRTPHRAAWVLGRIRDVRAMEPLKRALLHPDARVRAESAAALGELRDPATVEALLRATADCDHLVRTQASWALDRLGSVAVVIGVAALVRPLIAEALAAREQRPSLPDAEHGSQRTSASVRKLRAS